MSKSTTPRDLRPTASRLHLKTVATVGTAAVILAGYKNKDQLIKAVVRFATAPGAYSRVLALLVVLANFKNFPLVWHVSPPFPSQGYTHNMENEWWANGMGIF
jgi:hypothetical protein